MTSFYSSALFKMGEQDLIYYNLSLFNDNNFNITADVLNRRQGAIVMDPSKYEGSIVRFTVDANWPLFIPTIPNPLSPLLTNMSITFEYMGSFFQQFISVTPDEAKNGIFDFGIFLDDLNIAARAAWNAMKISFPGSPSAYPPYFALEPKTGLISMYVDDGWLDTAGAPNLIWFNSYLQDVINLPSNIRNLPPSANGTDYQIAVKGYADILPPTPNRAGYPYDLNGLAGNILQISQEFVQLSEFSDINTVMFSSNLIPVNPEFVPTNFGSAQESTTNSNFIPIITDFVITRDDAKPRDNSFVYNPTAEYRMFSMNGNTPITAIDCKAYYTRYDGSLNPLILPPGGSMTLKLLFRRKR